MIDEAAAALVAHLGSGDPARIALRLEDIVGEIRREWPAVEIDPERLAAAIAARCGSIDGRPEDALGRLRGADIYLADACSRGDPAAIAAFSALVDRVTERVVDRGTGDAAEIRQVVCERLLIGRDGPPKIAQYTGATALVAWIRVIATRIAIDDVRRRKHERPLVDALVADLADATPGPELVELKARYRSRFKAAIEAALEALDDRDRGVLRFTVEHELTADEIGRLYGVHRVTVARWLRSVRDRLTVDVLARLGVEADELGSVLRLVRSQLSLSLQRVLAE